MLRISRSLLAACLILGAASALRPALADDADTSAIRSTIERQIDAFRRQDASAAYAFASPGIKAIFPDADRFLAMVHDHYAPVSDPKSVSFGSLETTERGLTQSVTIIDRAGQAWTALYTLEKEPDGTWRIGGCVLVRNAETSV